MQLEIGGIYEGKVTGITKFGAFVDLGEGKTGMVHISEVAAAFVKEIKDFVTEGQTVKVKVISISEEGKISLSMKKAMPDAPKAPRERSERPERRDRNERSERPRRPYTERQPAQNPARPGDFEWQSRSSSGGSFEEMMSRFKATSDEKISDLKRGTEAKRGSFSARRGDKK